MTTRDAARILLRTRQALLVGACVLSAVWAWRREGIFRLFIEAEVRLTGNDDAFFTLLFTFLTLFVTAMALGAILTSVLRRRFTKEEWHTVLLETTALLDNAWWKRKER